MSVTFEEHVMTGASAKTEDPAEARLRSFMNDLMRLSLTGHPLSDITAEFDRFYVEYEKRYPSAHVYALRRFEDLKLRLFSDVMTDVEKNALYDRYDSYGYDDAVGKLYTLVFLHRSVSDGPVRERFERDLFAQIDAELDRGIIDATIAEIPEVIARVQQRRPDQSSSDSAIK
jgi:hypothetical protein